MQLSLKDELPVIPIRLGHHGTALDIPDVLIDTGSARTIFAADMVAQLGVLPAADDILYAIRGVGGREVVFARVIDELRIAGEAIGPIEIEVGGMDYGFAINGILGMDVLRRARALIDLGELSLEVHAATGS